KGQFRAKMLWTHSFMEVPIYRNLLLEKSERSRFASHFHDISPDIASKRQRSSSVNGGN
ncbi:hypothetical protein RvY_00451, partial [Ramazzottius varieornatus]